MSRYETYRASGIAGIGEIPSHWKVTNFKNIAAFKVGGTPPRKFGISENGEFDWIKPSDITENQKILDSKEKISRDAIKRCGYTLFPSGTIMFVSIASIGKIAILTKEAYSNQQITAISIKGQHPNYYLYFLLGIMEKIKLDANDAVVPILNTKYLKNIKVPLPPLSEQQAISAYLDRKIAVIDELKAKLEEQRESLKNYKKALIYKLVIRGVDPNVQLKDSGIDWLGRIPADWKVVRLKKKVNLSAGISPKNIENFFVEDGINWIRLGDCRKGEKYVTSTQFKLSREGAEQSKFVSSRELLLSNAMGFGEVYISKFTACVPEWWLILSPKKDLELEYLYYLLSSEVFKRQYKLAVRGAIITHLNITKVGFMLILELPLKEQQEIAAYLDRKTAEIDDMLQKNEIQLELLTKYRRDLILKVVSGKISVLDK